MTTSSTRNLGLDLLRVVAILLVIGRHMTPPADRGPILQAWYQGGWVGVDIFFVLSGFLISSLLFREYQRVGSVDVTRFLIRRGFKIYPPFWVFLAFSLVIRGALDRWPTGWEVAGEFLFLQNYLGGVWVHTWSLAVEEHFYLGFGAVVLWLVSTRSRDAFSRMPAIFALVAGLCLVLRIVTQLASPAFSYQSHVYGTHLRVDSLMCGVVLAYGREFANLDRGVARVSSVALVVVGAALLSPAFLYPIETHRWMSVFGVVLFYIGSGCLVLAALRLHSSTSFLLRGLGALGAASYSVYLWHLPVSTWGYHAATRLIGREHLGLYLSMATVGAFLFGWAMSRVVEAPVLALRDRLFPSRARAVGAAEPRRANALF